jgi:alkanesulfonate monooxygenase SsuD/methylene tetrahydromethanopterin reductase-like flavin-dependent oxidoreductase (luciferase family)
MDVGIGLPSTIPGVEGDRLLGWARRAEARGFSSLGTIDRIVYDNFEPLIALAAAAAVTERIKLATTILIAPMRANGALVAKQAASLDRLSNGRLVLGVAVGGRQDDYTASGVEFRTRGRRFGEMLEQWQAIWAGESFGTAGAIGPRPARQRPALMVGGGADVVFERVAAYGDGWVMGGGSPDQFSQGAEKLRRAWEARGREGAPQTLALAYFALGDRAEQAADSYLRDYYAFLGEYAGTVADSAAKDAATIRQYVEGFAAAGCDELVLFPCDPDPAQVDLLADAIGPRQA